MASENGINCALAQELFQKARDLQPVLTERAAQCAADRKVPDETIQDYKEAGFFRILQPKRWGGYELDPQVFYTIQTILAESCMSSAWVLGVVGVHNWQMGLFDQKAQETVWGDDDQVLISSSYAPVGKVTKVDGGFKLSGRWSFSSGSDHCDWVFLGAVVPEEGAPFDMSNYRTFLVPRTQYEIVDTWHVMGLAGTGSQDIVVDDVFIPENHTHKLSDCFACDHPGHAVNNTPLFHLPFGQVFVRAVCVSCIGALQGALDEFIEVVKTRQVGPAKMINDPVALNLVAEVKAAITEMKTVMYADFDAMVEKANAGEAIPVEDRVMYRYNSSVVSDRCAALSAKMLKASGGKGIFNGHGVLARHLDITASQAHVANNVSIYGRNLGAVACGLDNTDMNL